MGRHSDGGTHTSSAFVTHYDELDTCGCCGAREGDGPADCRDDVCREQARLAADDGGVLVGLLYERTADPRVREALDRLADVSPRLGALVAQLREGGLPVATRIAVAHEIERWVEVARLASMD